MILSQKVFSEFGMYLLTLSSSKISAVASDACLTVVATVDNPKPHNSDIDGLHLTSWRPCSRYNTKKYVANSIVGSSRRGWLTLSVTTQESLRLIANQDSMSYEQENKDKSV